MDNNTTNNPVRVDYDAETRIATMTLARAGGVNTIDRDFGESLAAALKQALAYKDTAGEDKLAGIIVTSAYDSFCVGADIEMLYRQRDAAAMRQTVSELNTLMRALETCGKPVVACLTGSALGGGYELAMACHRRLAIDHPKARYGLPEVTLGVIPGAGGTQRLPRMIGLQKAIEQIAQGKLNRPRQALKAGLVDALFAEREAMFTAARAWIAENPQAKQPWDERSFRFPAPAPGSTDGRDLLLAASGMLYSKSAGAYRAPELAIQAMHEGGLLGDLDRALEVESRYFVELAVSDQAKDMIRTVWYHRTAAEKHQGLPACEALEIEPGIQKVAILGAGMMGAALGFVCAQRGYDVVLKDIRQEALDKGLAHVDGLLAKQRHLDADARAEIRARVTGTIEAAPLEGTDLVIEAVFEDKGLKHQVTRELEPLLADNGIWASNTSALPITQLAEVSAHPERFIGLHFFSPVEKMPLLELIRGEMTDDATTARALAFCKRIGKLPIVVGDGYGFYTTRVFSAYILEGAQLVAEGHDPVLVEWAARSAGMAVGPLQVFDEVTLSLVRHAFENGAEYLPEHRALIESPAFALLEAMVDQEQRNGRAAGAGFYAYDAKGKRQGIWAGLATHAAERRESDLDELRERLLLIQAIEAISALERGVLQRERDAEVGAVFGLGFAPNRGGPLAYVDSLGAAGSVARLSALAERCGPRFAPPRLLREMAQQGKRFFDPSFDLA
jgi:3-hydroxyacyl-CoA dehydrogenase/enoyl-CoA hydratase/3-hydroxybutyryl-CoA epimerase